MKLTIQTSHGPQEVDAWQFGAFAAHRDPFSEPNDEAADWCVSHVRTGVAVPALFDCFNRAAATAQFLNEALFLGDFTAMESEEYAAFKPRARRILDGMARI
jgi:hypothetical protein